MGGTICAGKTILGRKSNMCWTLWYLALLWNLKKVRLAGVTFFSSLLKIKNHNYSQSHLVKSKTKDCYPLFFRQFCLGRWFKRETCLGNGLLKMCLSKRDVMLQRKEIPFYSQKHLVLIKYVLTQFWRTIVVISWDVLGERSWRQE